MSKPIYRIDTMAIAGLSYEDAMLILSVLVPVERCEHGNIDGHWIPDGPYVPDHSEWCPGAGIGETPVVLDDFENMILDRALDRMEGIGGDDE